ncbi:MAG: LacI family DNA-binding transcriptional regulator [Bacteroidota bacterium]
MTTLKKIAEELGISPSTVSKALKGYPDVSPKTREKVLALAKTLDYHPNSFAQGLRTNESKTIGLIVPELVHYFFSHIIKGVIDTARKNGYLVLVLPTEESYEDEVNQLKLLIDKNVDGILLSLSDSTVNYSHIKATIDAGTPIVLYDKISKSINASKVLIDDIDAAAKATEYLIKSGCKRIAHIRGPLKPQTTIDRAKGYKKALLVNGMEFDRNLVYSAENLSYEDGYEIALEILNDHPDIDGIFCFTDLVAMGALKRLTELGVDIPGKVSIIGFSNWFITKISTPTLTTVDQPGYDIGVNACDLLLDEIQAKKEDREFAYKTITVPTELVIRESTK